MRQAVFKLCMRGSIDIYICALGLAVISGPIADVDRVDDAVAFDFDAKDWRCFIVAYAICGIVITFVGWGIGQLLTRPALNPSTHTVVWIGVPLLSLASKFALHWGEWLILRRRLPLRSRKWYVWPSVNCVGYVAASLLFVALSSFIPSIVSLTQVRALTPLLITAAFLIGCANACAAGILSARWLGIAVAKSSWPYLLMRSLAGGLEALIGPAIVLLLGVFIFKVQFSSPMMSTIATQLVLYGGLIGSFAISGALQGGGLWMMARRAVEQPDD
jgi:hypothetical protein